MKNSSEKLDFEGIFLVMGLAGEMLFARGLVLSARGIVGKLLMLLVRGLMGEIFLVRGLVGKGELHCL